MHKTNILKNDDGQSAVEFILTFAFAIGVTFLFVNQTLNMTEGYLVHYANFMASRAYLVQDAGVDNEGTSLDKAADIATDVFNSYPLKNFGIKATFQVRSPKGGSALFSGTIAEFDKKLSSTPFLGGGDSAKFYSESFLGKEVLRTKCLRMICAAMTDSQTKCASNIKDSDMVLYDNGC